MDLRHYRGIVRGAVVVACWSLLAWQVSRSVQLYMRGDSMYNVRVDTGEPLPLPPFTFCAYPPYNPRLLANLGLDLDATTAEELERRLLTLEGIPDNMTVAQLVEAAAWRLGDMVQELRLGHYRETYDGGRRPSGMWSRSLLPWGPCWTLTLPAVAPGINASIRWQFEIPSLAPCTWEKDGEDREAYTYGGCEEVAQHCNTTCVWEEFVCWNSALNSFTYGLSSTYKLTSSAANFKGVSRPTFQLEPYEVTPIRNSGPRFTMQTCIEYLFRNVSRPNNCTVLSSRHSGIPARNVCPPTELNPLLSLKKRFNECVSNHREVRWKIASTTLRSDITVQLKPYIIRLRETLAYPFIDLLADVGGSFGLFVGVAFLSLWDWGGHAIQGLVLRLTATARAFVARRRHFSTSRFVGEMRASCPSHLRELLTRWRSRDDSRSSESDDGDPRAIAMNMMTIYHMTGMLLLFGVAAVHICLSIQETLITSGMGIITVTVVPKLSATSTQSPEEDLSPSEAVMGRLASRALGCRVEPPSSRVACHVGCMLRTALVSSNGFLPFINVRDLPLCTNDTANVNLEYKVPVELSQFVPDKMDAACTRKCRSKSLTTMDDSKMRYEVVTKGKKSVEDFLFDLGGIMSLYLGYSLFGLTTYAACHLKSVRLRVKAVVVLSVKLLLLLLATALCVSRASIYLYRQPVYTQVSSHAFVTDMYPAVTLCHWPPFNPSRLLHAAGHPELPDNFDRLPLQEQERLVVSTLEQLQQNSTQPLAQVWQSALWDIRDNIRNLYVQTKGRSTPLRKNISSTSLSSCYTITIEGKVPIGATTYLSMVLFRNASETQYNSYLYFAIHRRHEPPSFSTRPYVDFRPWNTIHYGIDSMTESEGVHEGGETYGECVHQCLEAAVRETVGCSLTWPSPQEDQHLCDNAQVARLLAAQWGAFLRTDRFYSRLITEQSVAACNLGCKNKKRRFYFISSTYKTFYTGDGFTAWVPAHQDASKGKRIRLDIKTDIQEHVVERLGYTLVSLISDVGGVVGLITGVSVLSLLTTAVNCCLTRPCPRKQNHQVRQA